MNAVDVEMELAYEMLSDAQLMLKGNRLRSLINRTYYGMFHAAKAILLYLGTDCQSHAGAINRFGEFVIKKGLVDEKLAKSLHRAYRLREKCDYQPMSKVDKKDAQNLYNEAKEFVAEIKKLISHLQAKG